MKLPTPFDPIVVGEVDDFVFDLTADMGNAALTSALWTCAFHPRSHGSDSTPQARIIDTRIATRIYVRSPIDGTLQIRSGFFAIATVGNAPDTAAGGTYMLGAIATVTAPDGSTRKLELNADLPCQAAVPT